MKRKSVVVCLIAVLFVLVAGAAHAESIPTKVSKQQQRIDQGLRMGQLTEAEATTLQGNLNHIKNLYYRHISEGTLTLPERRSLNRLLQQNSDMIYRKRHNVVRQLY